MSLRAPTSPYEAAWQEWNYNGGASRGEPMPRIEDYPDTFEEDLSGGPMATPPAPWSGAGESVNRGKYDRGGDLRELPGDEFDPSGRGTIYYPPGQRMEQMQPDYADYAPSPASPDEVYGAYAPQPAQPGMASDGLRGAIGNAMGVRGAMGSDGLRGAIGNAMGVRGAMGNAMKRPGLLKRAAGGLMGAMTLAQLNRRKGY